MRNTSVLAVVLVLGASLPSSAQRVGMAGGRTGRGARSTVTAPPIKGVVISFTGKVKEIAKKQILIQGDNGQLVTLRRNSKTQFVSGGQAIKPTDIDLESTVTVDAGEDNDLKLVAILVKAQNSSGKRPLSTR